jgi:hypothetical protein
MPSQVELIGHDKDIGSAEIDQRADIQPITEVGNYADKIGDKYQQYELVKSDYLFTVGNRRLFSQAGIHDVLIEGFAGQK